MNKSWADVVAIGGTGVLITQLRALTNNAAKKALQDTGKKELESGVFTGLLEQISSNLTKELAGKSAKVISAFFSMGMDYSQLKKIVKYANFFYYQRFISEKETMVNALLNNKPFEDFMEIRNVEFENVDALNYELLISNVAKYFNLDVNDILSQSRSESIVKARRYIAYLLDENTNMSKEEIGILLGGKKEKTISTYINTVKSDLVGNDLLQSDFEELLHKSI